MTFTRNKWLLRFGIILLVIVVLGILLNIILKQKIKSYLSNLPPNVQLELDDIHVNSFFGHLDLESPDIKVFNTHNPDLEFWMHGGKIEIYGLDYYNLFFNDKITLDELQFSELEINITKREVSSSGEKPDANTGLLNKDIMINKIIIRNSKAQINEHHGDSIVNLNNFNLDLVGFEMTSDSKTGATYYSYKAMTFDSKAFVFKTSAYEDIFIDQIELKNNKLKLLEFELKTRYTREELSRILKTERDHFDVEVDSIVLNGFSCDFWNLENSYVAVDSAKIFSPTINVFRDKLVNDNYAIRPLYGKMLRDLGINLSIDQLNTIDGELSYSEKVKAQNRGGRLDFHNINTAVYNLGNTYEKDTTRINIRANFMGRSHLDVHWNFVVQNPADDFSFSGELDDFNVGRISQFSKPNLNVEFRGELKKTYFNINGNPNVSNIDLQINFEDFEVVVLKRNGKEKNKFLSSLVNMFVSNNSDKDPNQFYHGNIDKVERDKTKSIFNFVWKNLQSGLLSAMTGSGKKKN